MRAISKTSTAAVTFALAAMLPATAGTQDGAQALEKLVNSNNLFAFALYRQVGRGDGNVFLSPASVHTALDMVYVGAKGETAEQMRGALSIDFPVDTLERGALAFMEYVETPDKAREKTKLVVANALWGQKDFPFHQSYLETLKKHFLSELETVDFEQDPEKARGEINHWVEEKTADKIQDLLPKGAVNRQTRLILANAIYFKANWVKDFPERQTRDLPFRLADGEIVQVPTMNQTDHFRYMETPQFQALEMAYKGSKSLVMIVALPRDKDGVAELEKQLDAPMYEKIRGELKNAKVELSFPKFKNTGAFSLKKALSAMGMPLAFQPKADFSGIASGSGLMIDEVIHKTFIAVDEEGTEAAAATAVAMMTTALPSPDEKIHRFNADHPFLYFISNRRDGQILFMGKMSDPRR